MSLYGSLCSLDIVPDLQKPTQVNHYPNAEAHREHASAVQLIFQNVSGLFFDLPLEFWNKIHIERRTSLWFVFFLWGDIQKEDFFLICFLKLFKNISKGLFVIDYQSSILNIFVLNRRGFIPSGQQSLCCLFADFTVVTIYQLCPVKWQHNAL